jgi:DNA adenine methylase
MNMIAAIPDEDGPRHANDINSYLIEMFKALSSGWIPPKTITRQFYEKCRNLDEELHVIGYVGFNCSYSGKWFGGYAGEVKTAIGTVRNYQEEAFRNIQTQIPKLKNVQFCSASYDAITIPRNSIVYCDPPYSGTTKYKDDFNHSAFWDWVRYTSNDHDVYVSEYSAPDDFDCVWQCGTTSSLSANGVFGGSKRSVEKLFRVSASKPA